MVSLKQIVVEKLGPLGDQTLELGRFNLVYGRNETGKTHLVEFLLRSLFRHSASWPMRAELGQGKVIVDGLGGDHITFTPETKEKLEDHWDESEAGLPTNMARLLVVKGAELELSDSSPEGIDRAVLKTALSSEALIDKIFDRIQATVQKARVVEGHIEANQTGLIKVRNSLEDDRERLSDLSNSVENRYAQGRLRSLELAHTELQDELAQQNEAKRHAAYQLHQERTRIQTARNKLPQEQLENLTRDIDRYQVKKSGLAGLREKEAEAKAEVMHYPWLRQAIELWERRGLEAPASGSNLYAFAAGAFLIFGLGLALAGLVLELIPLADLIFAVAAIAVFGVGLVLAYAYVVQIRRRANLAVNAADRHQIEIEFQQRFERTAGGLAGLKAQEQSLRESQARFEHLTEEIEESEAEIERLTISIEGTFKGIGAESVAQESWSKTVTELHAWAETQRDNIQEIDIRLTELGVDESDYRSEPATTVFSAERLGELEDENLAQNLEIREAERDLESLKQEITRETGDDIGAPWTELLDSLRNKRCEVDGEYRTTTARILGQIGVTQVLEQLRTEEDEKIREGLQANEVAELLTEVAGETRSLDFEDGNLVVRGETSDYDLSALSTGAREQVLLALRMGFASRLAGGQPLFLVLDDAFQHSDWERRERLVAQVVELAESGWQITYLTMDDHLRDLFKSAGETAFEDDFHYHEI